MRLVAFLSFCDVPCYCVDVTLTYTNNPTGIALSSISIPRFTIPCVYTRMCVHFISVAVALRRFSQPTMVQAIENTLNVNC